MTRPPGPVQVAIVGDFETETRDGLSLASERPSLSGGGYQPVASERQVYVQSEWKFDSTVSTTHGDDAAAGLTALTPLRTIARALELYGNAAEGVVTVIHLMGAGGADPVDAPTEGRIYFTRGFDVGHSEAYRSSVCFRGPKKMLAVTGNMTLIGGSDPGLYHLLNFDVNPTATQGLFLCAFRADGREVHFPWPINEVDGSGNISLLGTAASFFTDHYPDNGGYTAYVATPAAWIHSDGGDNKFHGVHLTGRGAYRIGDRIGGDGSLDRNPYPLAERIHFSRVCCDIEGSYAMAACRFDDNSQFRFGQVRFMGCSAFGKVVIQADGRYLTQSSQLTQGEEANGRMAAFIETGGNLSSHFGAVTMDPEWPTLGPDLVVTQNGVLQIGVLGGRGGTLRIHKGLAVVDTQGVVAITVEGPASSLMMFEAWLYIRNQVGTYGLWCKDGGRARLVAALTQIDGTSGAQLRVGKGANIALGTGAGQFMEVAGWNGNFTRRLEGSATAPADDDSRIWDASWEPAAYWTGV